MKDVMDNALFKQVKFYRSPQELNHSWDMFFSGWDKMEKAFMINWKGRLWAARCGDISTWICALRQHLYDQWYAISYGKSVFLFSIINNCSTYMWFLNFEFYIRMHLL